jgi:ribonuclease PH
MVGGSPLLDLCYEEDSAAEVDMNVVMTADGGLIETQATAEKGSFSRPGLNSLLDLAEDGLKEIFAAQRAALEI